MYWASFFTVEFLSLQIQPIGAVGRTKVNVSVLHVQRSPKSLDQGPPKNNRRLRTPTTWPRKRHIIVRPERANQPVTWAKIEVTKPSKNMMAVFPVSSEHRCSSP